MKDSGYGDFILEEDGLYEPGELFKSYHHQSTACVSPSPLSGYLSLWLNMCIMPSPPRDGIVSLALFPTIQLVYEKGVRLTSSNGLLHPARASLVDDSLLQRDHLEENHQGATQGWHVTPD